MIRCAKCDNDTRTSALVTAQGDVMLAGTIGTDPQPILAQVCAACGYIELYAPQPLSQPEATKERVELPETVGVGEAPVPAA
jgi:predicted nucleic-acid-binding Zn-ribbon protein